MGLKKEILKNEKISQNYFKITLDISEDSDLPVPGQFYNIKCSDTNDPLIRRPFSLHRWVKDGKSIHMEILYRVVGKGTGWLSRRKKGEWLDMIGPLGNGFIFEEDVTDVVLVARGIGIAPLYSVAEGYFNNKKKPNIFILMGARRKERIFYEEICKKIGEVLFYTDDGSLGFQGRAPDLLLHLLEKKELPERFVLYACGPSEMYSELAGLSKRFGFQGQVALEAHMGCGFGACLSCAIPLRPHYIKKGNQWEKPYLQWSEDRSLVYSLICKDGPIYDLQEVDWDEWLT